MQSENVLELQANEEWLRTQRNTLSLSQLADGSIQPPVPLFDGLLLHETLTMVSGEPYTGKTLFLLAIALSLASGKPLLGRFPPKELRRVLFIGQDAPTWDYAGQALKLARGYGIAADELKHHEVDLVLNEGIVITDKPFLEWLGQWHEATKFDVLMLDTLLDIHSADENSNAQMRVVMKQLKTIRDQLGCAILFSHHTGKPVVGDSRSANYMSRGATTIPGSSDFHFQLRQGRERVDMLWPKGRGAGGFEPPTSFTIVEETVEGQPSIRLEAATEGGRLDVFRVGLAEGSTRALLIAEVLKFEPGLGAQRASKWVDNQLQTMKKEGTVVQEKRGTWRLAS
jgi:hypothetical protein